MILDRLGVRGKLNLLLMLPLAAVVLVILGFASYKFITGVGRAHHAPAAVASQHPARHGGQPGSAAANTQVSTSCNVRFGMNRPSRSHRRWPARRA